MIFPVKRVNYVDPLDAAALRNLLREYARLEKCDRPELDELPEKLAQLSTAFSVLAYSDSSQREAIGLANCFFGYSTFAMQPLVNLHDVIVTHRYRGRGVASSMLAEIERIAKAHGCCRLTLEVYADNAPARRAYEKYGFSRDPARPDVDVHFLRKHL